MQSPRLIIAAALAVLASVGAHAANPSSQAISFPGGAISFPGGAISYPGSAISFPSSAISFPSAPIYTDSGATIEVTLPADILFDFDKADIRPTAQRALKEVADLIREKARGPVTIQGYTDALGKDDYNQKLSERRAGSVKTWLSTKESLPAARFNTSGFGARNPVAPNKKPDGSDDPEGRQLNRRVTLIIKK